MSAINALRSLEKAVKTGSITRPCFNEAWGQIYSRLKAKSFRHPIRKRGRAVRRQPPSEETKAVFRAEKLLRQVKGGYYDLSYPGRRKRSNAFIQQEWVREHVFHKCDHRCSTCGATDQLSVDHVIPVRTGGTNTLSNLQALCRPCNSRKGAR